MHNVECNNNKQDKKDYNNNYYNYIKTKPVCSM